MDGKRPEAFIFAIKNATPLNVCNYLNQVIKPAAERARTEAAVLGPVTARYLLGVNHQAFRRTCATYIQKHGTVKDVQAHLPRLGKYDRWRVQERDPGIGPGRGGGTRLGAFMRDGLSWAGELTTTEH